jgi:hypothetical protein
MYGEELVIGGDTASAERLIEEHNRQVQKLREIQIAEAAGTLSTRNIANGATMDPRDSTLIEVEPTDTRKYVADI